MPVKPVPYGYHSVTPYLIVNGAAQAIEFYAKAFGAVEAFRLAAPEGKIGHAELIIGSSRIMLADEHAEHGAVAPTRGAPHSVSFLLYLEDVDQWFARALSHGAKQIRPPADQFYGDRTGVLEDPFGHVWVLATHKEDLTPEELDRRAKAQHKK
jgi:PhnB protein